MNKQEFVMACVMAGCEYLNNIERVGLKVALKHFKQYGSFRKVVEYLQSNKTTKDRVPKDYIAQAEKVMGLFLH